MRFLIPVLLLSLACAAPSDRAADEAELLRLHAEVLEAHRIGDVERWMAVEADTVLSANGGEVTFPVAADRRAMRTGYLGAATFTAYRDLRPPVVRVSDDGTLGWLVAEVEVAGSIARDTSAVSFHDVWAWIELYEKTADGWRMTGNVSNRRPGGG